MEASYQTKKRYIYNQAKELILRLRSMIIQLSLQKALLLTLISFQLNAQQLPFAHLSIADGLEDTVVFAIEQDDLGFLWIATRTGINRFDGKQFLTYGQADGLPHNLARDLLKTKDGTLWVASEKGLAWFDGKKFHALTAKDGWPSDTSARHLEQSKDGSLWVATYGAGVLQIQLGENPHVIQNFNETNGLKSNRIRTLLIDKDNRIWLGSSKYVMRIDQGNVNVIPWNAKKSEVRTLFQHPDGSIWAGTRHGIARYDGSDFNNITLDIDLSTQTINTIMSDKKGNIWLGSRDFGAYQIDANASVIRHYDMSDGLPDNSINQIFEDSENNLWFGTYGGGIARLSTTMVLNWTAQAGMPNPNIYAIADDLKGCIWMGTNGNGVSRLCDGVMTHFSRKDGLPHNKVLSILIDKQGRPWFGTLQGLSQYIDGKFIIYEQSKGLNASVIYHIIQTSNGAIWLGSNNGLIKFHNNTFTHYDKSNGLQNNRINRILESKNGGLWLASANGLTLFQNDSFQNWTTDDGLPANFINDFYEDEKGGLWIASNNGLSYFFNGNFTNWRKKEGLPHNNCTVILPGKGTTIWIGTSRGVALFDGENFTVITSREGLIFDLINRGAGYKDPMGNLWFGTGDGLSRFAKDFSLGESNMPPIHLLSVSNNQIEIDTDSQIKIKQQDSSLLVSYTAISFQRAPDVNYRYRLVTNDHGNWRETRLREIQFESLAAGDYQFEVSARIGKGQWNHKPATFNFSITPPFWKTAWFMFLSAITLFIAFIYRNYRSRQNAIRLENIVQERTKQLKEMNEGLKWLANHDNLTKLANRNLVQQKIQQLSENQSSNPTDKHSKNQLAFMIIDLDHFKAVNDNYGHAAGDKALQLFSSMLEQLVQKDQVAARWGGEEFLIICPTITQDRMASLAKQIINNCSKLNIKHAQNQVFHIQCSVGFVCPPSNKHHFSAEKMIQLADLALYDAKQKGRNCAVGFTWGDALPEDWNFNDFLLKTEKSLLDKTLVKL